MNKIITITIKYKVPKGVDIEKFEVTPLVVKYCLDTGYAGAIKFDVKEVKLRTVKSITHLSFKKDGNMYGLKKQIRICKRCNYQWGSALLHLPKCCPRCHSPNWNKIKRLPWKRD